MPEKTTDTTEGDAPNPSPKGPTTASLRTEIATLRGAFVELLGHLRHGQPHPTAIDAIAEKLSPPS